MNVAMNVRTAIIVCSTGLLVQLVHADPAATTSASSRSSAASSVLHTRKPAKPAASTTTATTPAHKPGNDRLDLDTTTVTGNRELPKVLYIVPWKKADVGNLPGQPFNTLLDEALAPVDREVFRREVDYYKAISNKDQPGKGYADSRSNAQPTTQSQSK